MPNKRKNTGFAKKSPFINTSDKVALGLKIIAAMTKHAQTMDQIHLRESLRKNRFSHKICRELKISYSANNWKKIRNIFDELNLRNVLEIIYNDQQIVEPIHFEEEPVNDVMDDLPIEEVQQHQQQQPRTNNNAEQSTLKYNIDLLNRLLNSRSVKFGVLPDQGARIHRRIADLRNQLRNDVAESTDSD